MSKQESGTEELSWREKGQALYRAAAFQPKFALSVIALSVVAALLEGFGLSFIIPIIEVAQADDPTAQAEGLLGTFVTMYAFLGIPFTLGYLVAGVAAITTIRFITSFLVAWFRAAIETKYVRHLQEVAFNRALDADVAYFDDEGSDDILNAIVTQAEYAGQVIRYTLYAIEQGLLALIYFTVAFVIAPLLTVITVMFLGVLTVLFRNVVDGGYSLGDEVAEAKETIQSNAQAGTQGVREVKLFGMARELRDGFADAVDRFEHFRIRLFRNEAAITNFYQLATAVAVFVLIYLALTFASLSVGELGLFLFAMFRLGPKVSNVNRHVYRVEGELAHLVRTQKFVEELKRNRELKKGDRTVPVPIERVKFDDMWFSYGSDEVVLKGVSFEFERNDFVAFVGPSGAGKSTIASLLSRLYEPDSGTIQANGIGIDEFDIFEWRSRVTVVRQDPHLFNDTLRRNVTVGNREASDAEIERVCEIAQVTEFLSELPDGYDTQLGDQGVKLSGGQRQRVAIARALLKDADLLILDEATSDLDTSLEQRVHDGIESMDRDYAMLIIAHRLSTVTNADIIYAMENGKITESGEHDTLIRSRGTYSKLYEISGEI